MNETVIDKVRRLALELENNRQFYHDYKNAVDDTGRRRVIRAAKEASGLFFTTPGLQVTEWLNCYFNELYGFNRPVFWSDNGNGTSPIYAIYYGATPTQQPKEDTMNTTPISITNITYVNGQDVTKMTDDELFNAIRAAEAQIASYKAIGAQSVKLQKKIDELETSIQDLVTLIDSRP